MTDSEKRRRQLLEYSRQREDKWMGIPAVHPRYRAAYRDIYSQQDDAGTGFKIRLFVCFLLFTAFVMLDHYEAQVYHVDSQKIVNEIETDMNFAELGDYL